MTRYLLATALLLALQRPSLAHSPVPDSNHSDWCLGTLTYSYAAGGRVEDSFAALSCGHCSGSKIACVVDDDCYGVETCVDPGSKTEMVWWDAPADGAANDLATIGITQDQDGLFFAFQQWKYPDPLSTPIYQIAIDVVPGGLDHWYDPQGVLTTPGRCSVSSDRSCAGVFSLSDPSGDGDCWFCTDELEALPLGRPQLCGSGCSPDIPGNVCDMSQTCVDRGLPGATPWAGVNASPPALADYLVVFDSSRFLIGLPDAIWLMQNLHGEWTTIGAFLPAGLVGFAVGPGPRDVLEFEIPWSYFDDDFGPGVPFRFLSMIARASFTLDYAPDGPLEDVQSEAVAGQTSTTVNSCPGLGVQTTECELADGSQDAFVPRPGPAAAGGRTAGLALSTDDTGRLELRWGASCSAADTDYAVYSGSIGNYHDHGPLPGLCSTGGATSASIVLPLGHRYFLVVPTDGLVEGSYGVDSAGVERPAAAMSCRPQSLGDCP